MNIATCYFCVSISIIVILQFVAAEHTLESDYSPVKSYYGFEKPREYSEDFPQYDEYDFGEEENKYYVNQPVQIGLKSKNYNGDDDQEEDSCKKCGRIKFEKGGRVINGKKVKPLNKYPWIVPLFDNIGIRCGGAVISKKYVLTAAHCLCRTDASRYSKSGEEECVQNPKDYYIKLLGKNKLGKIVKIKRIISHPEFDFSKVLNDIALLELKEPLKCSKMTSPICLPTSEDLYENGQKLFIAGWGYYNFRKKPDRSNTILKEGVMKQVSSKKCMKPEVPKDTVRQYHCAVGTNHSACQGDSGTSTFIKYKKRFYTLGVVSHGTAIHCIPTYPTTFSKTLYFLDWIKEYVKDLPKP